MRINTKKPCYETKSYKINTKNGIFWGIFRLIKMVVVWATTRWSAHPSLWRLPCRKAWPSNTILSRKIAGRRNFSPPRFFEKGTGCKSAACSFSNAWLRMPTARLWVYQLRQYFKRSGAAQIAQPRIFCFCKRSVGNDGPSGESVFTEPISVF